MNQGSTGHRINNIFYKWTMSLLASDLHTYTRISKSSCIFCGFSIHKQYEYII